MNKLHKFEFETNRRQMLILFLALIVIQLIDFVQAIFSVDNDLDAFYP